MPVPQAGSRVTTLGSTKEYSASNRFSKSSAGIRWFLIAANRSRADRSSLPSVPDWNDKGTFDPDEWIVISHDRNNIRQLMWDLVGIVRSDFRLRRAMSRVEIIREEVGRYYRRTKLSSELLELRNMSIVAWLIVACARHRKESRGLHYNTDYPGRNDTFWRHDTIIRNEEILL